MRKLWSVILVTLLPVLGLSACMSVPAPEDSSYGPNGLKGKAGK
jgi:hypothetical protein